MINKKKVLIVGSFPPKGKKVFGGINRSSQILVDSFISKEFKIIEFDSSQISNPPPNFWIRLSLACFRVIKFIAYIILKKPNIAIIFCSDGWSAFEKGIMILICKTLKVKSLIFPRAGNLILQTNNSKLFRLIIKNLYNKADVFLCQGTKWKVFAEQSLNIDFKKTHIIQNWTATNKLLKIGKTKIIKDHKKLNISFVGWLEKEKGIEELIYAFKSLIQKGYLINLEIIGDGNLTNFIKKFIEKNKLNNCIFLRGWIDHNSLMKILKNSDIFVLPSWKEGMPNALIESISCGIPSIVTPVGVIPDFLEDAKSCLFCSPKDKNNLEKTIEKLINDINLRKKISKNAFLVAKKNFSTTDALKKLSNILNKINN